MSMCRTVDDAEGQLTHSWMQRRTEKRPVVTHRATATFTPAKGGSMTTSTVTPSCAWRTIYRPHACAEVFPMMSDSELDELGQDILKHGGLTQNVVLWRDPSTQDVVLLDGRNRLEALTRLGAQFEPNGSVVLPDGKTITITCMHEFDDLDPAAFVISANIRRRHLHLTKEQQ